MAKLQINTSPVAQAAALEDGWTERIHQGDCIATMQRLPSGSVHLVFADPPFNIGYDYDTYDDRLEESRYLEWSSRWMSEVHRVLVPVGRRQSIAFFHNANWDAVIECLPPCRGADGSSTHPPIADRIRALQEM